MRQLFLALVVTAAGCAAQGLPIEGGNGTGAPGGGSGGNTGGSGGPDLAKPLGGDGAMCQTACDCQPGLACNNGSCAKSMFGPIYCCESNNCPDGSFCESSMGGFGQCSSGSGGSGGGGFGGGGGGGFFGDMSFPIDAGVVGSCSQIKCSQTSDCTAVGCMTCGRRGTCR